MSEVAPPKPAEPATATVVDVAAFKALEAEAATMRAALASHNAEAKKNREANEKLAADKAQAEKDAAAKGGELGKLLEIERAEKAAAAARLAELAPKAEQLGGYEAAIKLRVDAAIAKLPEAARPKLDGVPLLSQLSIVESMAAIMAGKPAAPAAPVVVGQPGAPGTPIDTSKMTHAELIALGPAKLAEIRRTQSGAGPGVNPFGA